MDGQVRELRARFAASGSDDDKARYLRARVRAGEQDEESLLVGVWLGDEVAREVGAELLGDEAVTLVASRSGFTKLLELLPGGRDVQVRALLAAYGAVVGVEQLEPELKAGIQTAVGCDDPPTAEQKARAREARLQVLRHLGVAAYGDAIVRGIAALLELQADGWETTGPDLGGRARDARAGLIDAFGGSPRWKGPIRAAIVPALLPWVYLRATAPPPRPAPPRLWTPEQQRPEEPAIFVDSAMSPAAVEAVLRLAPAKRPTLPEARALIEAYLFASGWRLVRTALVHEDGRRRIKLTERAMRLEVGGPGAWERREEDAGRSIGLVDVAQRLIDGARRREQGG